MPGVLMQSSVVVPTIGRPSLDALLRALAGAHGPRPAELILVDDRPSGPPLQPDPEGLPPVRVVRTGGGGPPPAPNPRWRAARPAGGALPPDPARPAPPRDEGPGAPPVAPPAPPPGRRG